MNRCAWGRVVCWHISNEPSFSDHMYIRFQVKSRIRKQSKMFRNVRRKNWNQGCRSLLSIGGIICNLTPILPYFQHWGMNLDHDFVQVSKLSENQQKKGLHRKWKQSFSRSQVKIKKKGFHLKWNTFFPEFKWTYEH